MRIHLSVNQMERLPITLKHLMKEKQSSGGIKSDLHALTNDTRLRLGGRIVETLENLKANSWTNCKCLL